MILSETSSTTTTATTTTTTTTTTMKPSKKTTTALVTLKPVDQDEIENRRNHVEQYCKSHAVEMQEIHDKFNNRSNLAHLIFKQNCYLYYNKPADVAFCSPPKTGSSQTTRSMFDATYTIQKVNSECKKTASKNPHYDNCIQWDVSRNYSYDEISKMTTKKFMFYRHPMSRLVSSWKHGQGVSFFFPLKVLTILKTNPHLPVYQLKEYNNKMHGILKNTNLKLCEFFEFVLREAKKHGIESLHAHW